MLEWTVAGHLQGNGKGGVEHGHKTMGAAKIAGFSKDAHSE